LKNAITLALQEAARNPGDIDYVCACANSINRARPMETNVIKEVFGPRARSLPVSSIKSMVGESFSASGALSLTAAVGALRKEMIPQQQTTANETLCAISITFPIQHDRVGSGMCS